MGEAKIALKFSNVFDQIAYNYGVATREPFHVSEGIKRMLALSLRRLVASGLFSGIVLIRAAVAADVPAPMALDNADVAGYVVLPDIKRLLTTAEGVAKQIAPPNEFKEGMLAAFIGGKLGDPTLSALVEGKPLLFTFFKMPVGYNPNAGPPPIAVFLPLKDSPVVNTLKEQLANDQHARFVFEDGLFIIATTDEMLAKAKTAKALYAKIADAKIDGDARVYVNIASIVETFGPGIKVELDNALNRAVGDIQRNPPPPELGLKAETAQQVVKLFFKVVNGLLQQADAIQFDLRVKPDGIRLEQIFAAKPGTLLADYLSGNPAPSDPRLQSFLSKGFELVYVHSDIKANAAFVHKAVDAIAADPEIAELAQTDYVKAAVESVDADGGEGLVSVGASPAGGLDITMAGLIKDQAKYEASMEKMFAMTKAPLLGMILNKAGVTLNWAKNAREHGGVGISKMTIEVNPPNAPPEAAMMIKKLVPQPEFAVSKGFMLMSATPALLDVMLDKVEKGDFTPSPVSLKSMAAFGKDKNFYLDYDIVGYMRFVLPMVAGPNGAGMLQGIKSNDPLMIASVANNGRAMFQIEVPLAPILETVKLYLAMQMGVPPPKLPDNEKKEF